MSELNYYETADGRRQCLVVTHKTGCKCFEPQEETPQVCSACHEPGANLIPCTDCGELLCKTPEVDCSYDCVDCEKREPRCLTCLKAHEREGHSTDSDTAAEMYRGKGVA